VTYHTGNITTASRISSLFSLVKPEVVLHAAGLIPSIAERLGLNMEKDFTEVNVEGTRNLLEASKGGGVKAFVFTGSADVVK
jgi:sterol-4alpha-carboxylate 3-dehydrogenase (decarboxylating)